MSNTGWIALGIVFLVVLFAGNQYAQTVTGDSPISVASRTVSLDLSSDGFLVDRADGLGFRNCTNDDEIPVWEAASSDWLCGIKTGGAGGSFVIQVDDVTASGTTTVVDLLGDDFTVSESPSGEANISLNALMKYQTATELTISGDSVTVTQSLHKSPPSVVFPHDAPVYPHLESPHAVQVSHPSSLTTAGW